MNAEIYIGTSGWHYDDWVGLFYPSEIKGYNELRYHAQYFNTVENNSSFYRIAGESTYKTWSRMTPEPYKFSMKLNKDITHIRKLSLDEETRKKIHYVLETTQVLKEKLGAIVIQLPASFKYDITLLETFLCFFTTVVKKQTYSFDVAIEFRNKYWFNEDTYALLRKYNIALVASQSSRYPEVRQVTADFAYIRMHGPEKLFASKYTIEQLQDWASYVRSIQSQVKRVYIYFNNDFHGYALENAKELKKMLK